MNFLFPNRYKKLGAILGPVGFTAWILMQIGFVKQLLLIFLGKPETTSEISFHHTLNVAVAITSFLAFLFGVCFVSFSKEKMEDEMVKKIRLDSLQFAAQIQMLITIVGFAIIIIIGSPPEGLLMLFLIGLLLIFWLAFVTRFNYILHISNS